jgi:NhaP-type Na+/H+ or K+/H+ antiporter
MSGDGGDDYGHVLLFLCLTMLFIVAVYELRKRIKIPASLLLVLAGVFMRTAGVYIGAVHGSVFVWREANEWSTLLFILPALIFECGFTTDWYFFKRRLPQILLMATTAVILHTALVAVTLKQILQFDFSWDKSFLIGAILSATDHITVMSQIKELKVEKSFQTLIQGETLLIDGTVMVLFFVLLARVMNSEVQLGESLVHFIRLSFGGVGLGLVFCIAFAWAIKRIINDEVLEVNMTIVTTYLIFFTAEDSGLEFSGAISTVTFGLYMSALGKTLISPAVEHSLHVFWEILSKNTEGLIFVISGLLLAELYNRSDTVTNADIWKTTVLFVLLHFIRGIVILVHYPLLSRLGNGLNWREAVLLSLAGAKGVISTSLGILVWHNSDLSEEFREKTLFIVVINSTLSVFIDSFIILGAMKAIGLGRMPDIKEHSLLQVTRGIIDTTEQHMEKLSEEYKMVRWDHVNRIVATKALVTRVLKHTDISNELLQETTLTHKELLDRYADRAVFSKMQVTYEIRRRCLMTLKGLYWEHFEEGHCQGSSALRLIESADFCLERIGASIKDWEFAQRRSFSQLTVSVLQQLAKRCCLKGAFESLNFDYLVEAYDVSSAFIKVHEETIKALEVRLKTIDPSIVQLIRDEFEDQLALAKDFQENCIARDFPNVVAYVQTKQASYSILNAQHRQVKLYYAQGLLDAHEYAMLEAVVNRCFKTLTLSHALKLNDTMEMLKTSAIVLGLSSEDSHTLIELCREAKFTEGQYLYRQGGEAEGCFFILRGRVEETADNWTRTYSTGEGVGEHHLLSEVITARTSVVACTEVLGVFIPKSEEALHIVGNYFLKGITVKLLTSSQDLLEDNLRTLSVADFKKIAEISKVSRYSPGDRLSFASGGFLIFGELGRKHRGRIYFPPANASSKVRSEAAFMHFENDLTLSLYMSSGDFKGALLSLHSYCDILPGMFQSQDDNDEQGKVSQELSTQRSFAP